MDEKACLAHIESEFHKLKATGDFHEWVTEFVTYTSMFLRCYSPSYPEYPNYGGKGETVKEEWITGGFPKFLEDVGPTPQHKIDMELDAKVLEATALLLVDAKITPETLNSKILEIKDDVAKGREIRQEDMVKFTSYFFAIWFWEATIAEPELSLVAALRRFKKGERPTEDACKVQ